MKNRYSISILWISAWNQVGSGVVGELPEEESELGFLQRIKELFQVGCVKHSALTGKPIREVALCGGERCFPDQRRNQLRCGRFHYGGG